MAKTETGTGELVTEVGQRLTNILCGKDGKEIGKIDFYNEVVRPSLMAFAVGGVSGGITSGAGQLYNLKSDYTRQKEKAAKIRQAESDLQRLSSLDNPTDTQVRAQELLKEGIESGNTRAIDAANLLQQGTALHPGADRVGSDDTAQPTGGRPGKGRPHGTNGTDGTNGTMPVEGATSAGPVRQSGNGTSPAQSHTSHTSHTSQKPAYPADQQAADDARPLSEVAAEGLRNARAIRDWQQQQDEAAGQQGEGGQTRFSLNEFADHTRFVDLKIDQHLFDGLSEADSEKLARKIINERFSGKIIGIDNPVFVNGVGAGEYAHPSKPIDDPVLKQAKMRASAELDNLVDAGKKLPDKADGESGHTHTGVSSFSYLETIFKIGDRYYKGIVNIANNRKGRLFKDVTKIEDITKAIAVSYGQNPKYAFLRDVSMPTVPQSPENANPEGEKAGQSDKSDLSDVSDEMETSSRGGTSTTQSTARNAGSAGVPPEVRQSPVQPGPEPRGRRVRTFGGDDTPTHRAVEQQKQEFTNVRIEGVRTFADLPLEAQRIARARGFHPYDVPALWCNGKVYIVEDNCPASQVRKFIFHEAVGHDGLRKVLGARFEVFLDDVLQNHAEAVKAFSEAHPAYGFDLENEVSAREAAEEFLADLASKEEFRKQTLFRKIAAAFRQFLRRIPGFRNIAFTDNEIAALLRKSYKQLTAGQVGPVGQVGQSRFAVNDRQPYYEIPFAEGVKRVVDPAQKDNRAPIFVSETPEVLQKIGFTALPMMMNARHLRLNYYTKAEFEQNFGTMRQGEHAHGLHGALEHLPQALAHPLAVVVNHTPSAKPGSVVAITDMDVNGQKIVVPVLIEAESTAAGERIDSHLVLTVYDSADWMNTFLKPAMEAEKKGIGIFYFDKEKADRYSAYSKKIGSIPTGFVHNIAEAGINVKPQTETLQFNRWFNGSKVVDENGEPLVVYHGTDENFTVFDMDKSRANMDIRGAFFSPWEEDSRGYGKNVGAFYLSIKNPASSAEAYKALNLFKGQDNAGVKARDYLIRKGYDGVNVDGEEYIAFYPAQIKSATDNIGTFDPKNPDVRFAVTEMSDNMEKDIIKVLKPFVGNNLTRTDTEYQTYLAERGVELSLPDAHRFAVEAMNEVRSDAVKRGNRMRDQWIYENNLLYRYCMDFAGKDFVIKPGMRYDGEDFSGSFISPEFVKYSRKRPQGVRESDGVRTFSPVAYGHAG